MSYLKHIRVIAPLMVFLVIMTILVTARGALVRANLGLTTVSKEPSPYASCSNAGQTGTLYVSAEEEPWVSVNPKNTNNIIGVFQQDRWSNGGAHGLVAGFSSDGGGTWGESNLPFSACAGSGAIKDPFTNAPYDRASDAWVSIGPDGTAYAVGLLATESTVSGAGNNDTGVAAVTSSDGGQTWVNPNLIKSDQGTSPIFEVTHFFNDKESVTADPLHAGTAYVVWDRLLAPSHSPDADLHSRAFRGPTWFSKTTDGGQHWTGTRAIFDPGQNSQTIGNQIVVGPTGVLYDFFQRIQSTGSPSVTPRGNSISFIKSSDGGTTWSQPTVVSAEQTVADTDPNTGAAIRTGEALPEVAVDTSNTASKGNLYVVWEDARFTSGTVNQAVISMSTNGGANWSTPEAVSPVTGRPAFTPAVAVNSAGEVGVTYYDFRGLTTEKTTLPTDYWFRPLTPSSSGLSLGTEVQITGPFDMLNAPFAGGFFVGDYEALTSNGSKFEPFFVQTNTGNTTNRTDVFTTFI